MRLFTTPQGTDEERMVAGRRVRELYPHLQGTLRDHPRLQRLFAQPVFETDEPDTHWETEGRVDQGQLKDQPPEVQQAAKAQLRQAIGEVKTLAAQKRALGTSVGHDMADILEAALLVADDNSIRVVDGAPVIAGWGRSPVGQSARNTLLFDVAGYDGEESADALAGGNGGGADGLPPGAADPALTTATEEPRIIGEQHVHVWHHGLSWLAPFLWLLSLLLLLVLLWLYLSHCSFLRLGPGNWLANYCSAPVTGADTRALEQRLRDLEREYDAREAVCLAPTDPVKPVLPPQPRPELEPNPQPEPEPQQDEDRVQQNGGAIGSVNIMLAWEGQDDLDLYVICPAGDRIPRGGSSCGGTHDLDMNIGANRSDEPAENVVFTEPPEDGTYRIQVERFRNSQDFTKFRVIVTADRAGERVTLKEIQGRVGKVVIDVGSITFPYVE